MFELFISLILLGLIYHIQIEIIFLLYSYTFSPVTHWLIPLTKCWNLVNIMASLPSIPDLSRNSSSVSSLVRPWLSDWFIFHYKYSSIQFFLNAFTMNWCWISSMALSASMEIITFFSFRLLIWCIILMDFLISSQTWSKSHLIIVYYFMWYKIIFDIVISTLHWADFLFYSISG